MPNSSILISSDHNIFTQFSSESFRCSLANFRWACACVFLRRGTLRALQDFSPSRCSVLPIVFLVTMVPAALRSLSRSYRVVLGWFFTVLMIIENPRGEILHGAQDWGRLTVILCLFDLRIITINCCHLLTRDGSRFSNIRIFYLILEYRLGCAIIF